MKSWQVQQAKTHLSEIMDRAAREGPQTITRHGKPTSVLMSVEGFEALTRGKAAAAGTGARDPLIDFLLNSGPILDDIDLERDRSPGREIDLE